MPTGSTVAGMERGRRGREGGRAMIMVALVLATPPLFLWIAAPGFRGGGIGASEPPPIELVGVAMYVIGLTWMVRIYRGQSESVHGAWRYRNRSRVMPLHPERKAAPMERGRRGRELAKVELILAFVMVDVFLPFLWVAAPAHIEPMFATPEPPIRLLGFALANLGLVWMVRIYRANPEPDQHAWRYRAR